MRFGLFYEHQLPRPWADGAEETMLRNALEQVELADRLGIDSVWEVEHHFLEEYSHSSAPEVFLAAASQRTRRIRLGHGIVQLPPRFNHPARIAERIATLDLISGGRVEFGTGEASSQMELGGFGVDRETKRQQWEEALDVVTRMLVEEPFAGHRGAHIAVPPRNVVPKPRQRPHPPLWVACSRRETIRLAARKGIGALSFSFVEPEEARQWVDEYYGIIASDECVPGGFAVNPNVAVVLPLMCHRDEQTAIDRGIDGAHFFGYSLAHYYVFGEHAPGRTDLWQRFLGDRDARGFAREIVHAGAEPLGVKLLQQGLGSLRGAIGTPDQVAALLQRYQQAGVDQVIFVAQSGNNRHEHVCESLELFAAEVLPRFAAGAEAAEQRKRERLAAAVESAMRRRRPPQVAPDHLVTPQGEPGSWTVSVPSLPVADGDGSNGAAPDPLRAHIAGLRAGLGDSLRKGTDALLVRAVSGRGDAALERTVVSRPGLWVIFKGMARAFRPEAAQGFSGEIEYVLSGARGTERWTIEIRGERATARRAAAAGPAVTLSVPMATFARIAARTTSPARELMEGNLRVEGDFAVAARLAEMFGESSPF
jgi:alkanesulfonate monooxygenase SsuD/methylene tetrahydromethanopterin reductase-like flavin-dependent oxidoreductase (luciferase family)/putative sterol carrier protein